MDPARELTLGSFKTMLTEMTALLEADTGHIEASFPFFLKKAAPVSGVNSLLNYQVNFHGELSGGNPRVRLKVVVPVTSLCPCSKSIAAYGAHNQRAHVTLDVRTEHPIW